MSVIAKKWIFSKFFEGDAKLENFKLVEEKLDRNIKSGEVLVEAVFLSVDPYMRVSPIVKSFMDERKSDVIVGTQVASMTAYFGVHDVLKPTPGEVVVISSAAGAVGSLVGQIAKQKGAKVIGTAGSQAKLDWLTGELGFDHAFNYKTTKLEDALKKYAPGGVDCYFDNVGGEFMTTMVKHMNENGRIASCGSISTYKDDENQPKGPYPWYYVLLKKLLIKGFQGWAEIKRWPEAQKEMLEWVQQGKLKYREHVTKGFDKMPTAFLELFQGKNIGKAMVKV